MDSQRIARFIEFLFIGIGMGVTEDIIAIAVTTDADITPEMIGIAVVVALPFAVLSELVVDHPAFGYFEQMIEHALTDR